MTPTQTTMESTPGAMERLRGWRIAGSAPGALRGASLIVATYKRPDEVIDLLTTLLSQVDLIHPDTPDEVVIVDGSPSDALGTRLFKWAGNRDLPFDLAYVRSPAGLTRQRNAGIDVSRGFYVFFLDDDSEPLPGYFREMHRVFTQDQGGRIGALGGSVLNEMDKPIPRRWRWRLRLGLTPPVPPMTYHASGTSTPKGLMKQFHGVRPVDVLPGCAFTFRREVFSGHRFSGFFNGYSQGEDLEMSLRVGREWDVMCCGDAHMLHHPAASGRPASFAKGRMEIRNRFFIWKRHAKHAAVIDRLRFWLDAWFLMAMDLAWFCRRPSKPHSLAHAAGVLWAAVECVFSPPRYQEPPARPVYAVNWQFPTKTRDRG
jgi:GT2 family glycosyltransferase